MGFFSGLSHFFKTVVSIGRAFAGAAAPVLRGIVEGAKHLINEVSTAIGAGMRDDPATQREHYERELQQVNEEVIRLRMHYQKNHGLPQQEKRRWEELKRRRDALNEAIANFDQEATAQDIVAEEKHYQSVAITNDTAHILQYHIGQSAYNKTCVCGRVMVLQWKRQTSTAGLQDFFWGCSGWYEQHNGKHACQRIAPLTHDDLNLFANLNRPEFEVDSETLTREVINPTKARRIRQALDSVRGTQQSKKMGIATYRCPIHGESLRLQRKNQRTDQILDEYFLGCPRWLPDNMGCNFLVKLKSAAQISSVLNTEQRLGVLDV